MTEKSAAIPETQRVEKTIIDADAPKQDNNPNQHDTLKYHLLGPSLTKAGQDSVDQSKVPWDDFSL